MTRRLWTGWRLGRWIRWGRRRRRRWRCRCRIQGRWVDTGDPVPDGFDAVIMIEVVQEVDDSTILITTPAPPYQHVRPLGEDIVASELLLPENHRMRPADLGACAAAGVTSVSASVAARPSPSYRRGTSLWGLTPIRCRAT